ncbi:MAG: sigma-70 family RNA polymerase sigma factor [Proteobacteria bacterium]|nr:sigma-70 family RNA polymerase sigma factor [Pseudomonadota bacterium]
MLVARRGEMLSYVYANTLDMHAAEDIYQDLLVKVMRREESYDSDEHVIRWAQRVVRNAAIDLARRSSSRVRPLDDDVLDMMEAEWDALDAPEHSELIEHLRECLQSLSPATQQILELRYKEGLSGQSLSKRVDRPAKSIYVTISRAYRTLSDCIERRQREAERNG